MHRVPHSPELMRTGSNVAHWVIGTILGVAALLALVQVLPGRVDLRLWWSAGLAVLGLLFVLFLILHLGFRLLPAWIADLMEDSQQRQHLVMGLLLIAGGAAEFAVAGGRVASALPGYVWPATLVIIGVMFVLHTQHGTHEALAQSVRYHRLLGMTLVLAGLLAAANGRWPGGFLGIAWPVAQLVAAAELLAYREPPGAWWNVSNGRYPPRPRTYRSRSASPGRTV